MRSCLPSNRRQSSAGGCSRGHFRLSHLLQHTSQSRDRTVSPDCCRRHDGQPGRQRIHRLPMACPQELVVCPPLPQVVWHRRRRLLCQHTSLMGKLYTMSSQPPTRCKTRPNTNGTQWQTQRWKIDPQHRHRTSTHLRWRIDLQCRQSTIAASSQIQTHSGRWCRKRMAMRQLGMCLAGSLYMHQILRGQTARCRSPGRWPVRSRLGIFPLSSRGNWLPPLRKTCLPHSRCRRRVLPCCTRLRHS